MIDELVLNYVFLFLILELYEVHWQKAQTIMGMLARMYQPYSKNVFLFLLMQPTFYFSIMFLMLSDYNIYAITLLSIKSADVIVKILLLEQVFVKQEMSQALTISLLAPVHKLVPYLGAIFYPMLIVLAM